MAKKLQCIECEEPAKWVRYTQFAGDHPFCDSCARKEKNFRKKDDSNFFWEKIKQDKK